MAFLGSIGTDPKGRVRICDVTNANIAFYNSLRSKKR